jgi:hypothetical protein
MSSWPGEVINAERSAWPGRRLQLTGIVPAPPSW